MNLRLADIPPTRAARRPQLVANTNDLAIGHDVAHLLVDFDQDGREITGFEAPHVHAGRPFILTNVGSYDGILRHQSSSSRSSNRLIHPDDLPLVIRPADSFLYAYDPNASRWRAVAGHEGFLADSRYVMEMVEHFLTGHETSNRYVGQSGMRSNFTGSATGSISWETSGSGATFTYHEIEVVASGDRGLIYHNKIAAGQGLWVIDALVKMPVVSHPSDEYFYQIGLLSSISSTTPNGVMFVYDRATTGFWQAVTKSGSTTSTTTAVAVSTDWHHLRIWADFENDTVKYYIGGTLVATHTTNVPSSTDLSAEAFMTKTAGSSARHSRLEHYRLRNIQTSRRLS